MLLRNCFLLSFCSFLLACEVTPDIQKMEQEHQILREQVVSAQEQIRNLQQQRSNLSTENAELKRVMAILDTEKDSRVDESTELRMQVRRYTQSQIDNLKDFMLQSNLLDYIGEELVERTSFDEQPTVFVDFDNAIPRSGSLMGVSGFFSRPTEFSVNVLRPVDGRFVVIWQSQSISVVELGLQRLLFPVSVGVEKGDLVAFDFPISVGVKYDTGTGNSLLSKKSFVLGASVEPSSLKAKGEKRAYSLGVVAILKE